MAYPNTPNSSTPSLTGSTSGQAGSTVNGVMPASHPGLMPGAGTSNAHPIAAVMSDATAQAHATTVGKVNPTGSAC